MGVKAGGNYTTLDLANLTLDNNTDPAFDNPVGQFMPNLDLDFTTIHRSGMQGFHLHI